MYMYDSHVITIFSCWYQVCEYRYDVGIIIHVQLIHLFYVKRSLIIKLIVNTFSEILYVIIT